MLAQAAEAIIVCDEKGRVIRASDASAELCRRNPLYLPFEQAFRSSWPRIIRQNRKAATLQCPNGRRAELLVSAAPLQGAHDNVIGCVFTLVDVSEHRRDRLAYGQPPNQKELKRVLTEMPS